MSHNLTLMPHDALAALNAVLERPPEFLPESNEVRWDARVDPLAGEPHYCTWNIERGDIALDYLGMSFDTVFDFIAHHWGVGVGDEHGVREILYVLESELGVSAAAVPRHADQTGDAVVFVSRWDGERPGGQPDHIHRLANPDWGDSLARMLADLGQAAAVDAAAPDATDDPPAPHRLGLYLPDAARARTAEPEDLRLSPAAAARGRALLSQLRGLARIWDSGGADADRLSEPDRQAHGRVALHLDVALTSIAGALGLALPPEHEAPDAPADDGMVTMRIDKRIDGEQSGCQIFALDLPRSEVGMDIPPPSVVEDEWDKALADRRHDEACLLTLVDRGSNLILRAKPSRAQVAERDARAAREHPRHHLTL